MTLIGKLLAFLNLFVGLGILTTSVTVYTMRPAWFDPIPEGVSLYQTPENFKQMQAEIEALTRSGLAASANTTIQKTILEKLENVRKDRQDKYKERLNWAKNGNDKDKDKDKAGFYEPIYNKDTGLLDVDGPPGPPIKGGDNKPLKGSEKLLANYTADVEQTARLAEGIVAVRKEFDKLRVNILRTELQLLRMTDIRENVQAELFYLSSFEVNVYETRETVLRRKKQLDDRLKQLR